MARQRTGYPQDKTVCGRDLRLVHAFLRMNGYSLSTESGLTRVDKPVAKRLSDADASDPSEIALGTDGGMTGKVPGHSGPVFSVDAAAAIPLHFANATDLAIIAIDQYGVIEFANPSATRLFDFSHEQMIGSAITIIIPERMHGAHNIGLARVADGAKPNLGGKTVEVTARRRDGSEFPIEITLSVWTGAAGIGAAAVIKDISERRERDVRLLRQASQDTLTGLHNRHQFDDLLRAQLLAGEPAAVFLIDLDGFKDVNDTHGHAAGDALLQAIGVRLPYLLQPEAEVARIGGDEFAVLLPDPGSEAQAGLVAASIVQALSEPFDLGGHAFEIGASVGYAVSRLHGQDAAELIASADFALYRAKSSGGRQYRMFEPSMRSETLHRRQMRDDLLTGLRRDELVLHFQPQVLLDTGAIFGLEALIRWRHPLRGLLLPGAFLPALEQSALALEIGWWTLDRACQQLAVMKAEGQGGIKIGVNLFPGQVRAANLCRKVAEVLEKYAIEPAQLELEVTETAALHDDDKSLESLTALRRLGVGIAFDDFGTGFASLRSLQRYPLTTLKIDRGFIRDILLKPRDAAITRALIALSRDLGLQTIAEGIETEKQELAVRALGCPAAQGFRYGRAMPPEEILASLARAKARVL